MRAFHPLLAALAAFLAAGCATTGPEGERAGSVAEAAVPRIDLGSKFRLPNREKGKRARAVMNAKYQLETESDERGPPSAAQIFRAYGQRREIERQSALAARPKGAGLQPHQWQSIGPSNVGGRVRAIAFDPGQPARVLAGTASGGLWISNDRAASWHANNDFLPNLSVTTIVFDPSNPSIAYLGTGEASAGLVGVGAFKSVDGGTTWRHLPATDVDAHPDWRYVNRLAIHPSQPRVLLAGVTHANGAAGAIHRSVDGGESWTRVASLKALDLAFEPGNPANALAGLDDGTIAYSRDAGLTWTRTEPLVAAPAGRNATARAEIAFARAEPGLAYASVDNARGEIWRSRDSGATWEKTATPGHLGDQGDYDNAIWVDPIEPLHVIAGGLDLYQSWDGGTTFVKVSDWTLVPESPHADHHALASPPDYGPGNRLLLDGSDGGIYKAADVTRVNAVGPGWQNANNGLAVTQFYSGAGRTASGGRVIGGTQDNGSLVLSRGEWRAWRGADGGYVAVDPASDEVMYGEIYYLAIFRTTNGGGLAQYICNGITEAYNPEGGGPCGSGTTEKAAFIAPFILDPNNRDRMLAGANSLWVSDNVRAPQPAWRAIKPPAPGVSNYIYAVAAHEGNGNVVWVGHNDGSVYRSVDALAAQPAWQRRGQGVLPGRRVMRITIDRDDPDRVIVAYTGFVPDNVWETRDGGASWRSINGNLPFAPVFDVKRHPAHRDWLYAATSVGVFTTEDGGASWSTTNEGPGNIRVRELFWIDDATLGAATYGRGMFKVAVAGSGPASYQDLWWAGVGENGWGMSLAQHGATIFGALYVYDAAGNPTWYAMPGGAWDAGFTTYSGALYSPTGSWFGSYDATRFRAGDPVGAYSIRFHDRQNATFSYRIHGVDGAKEMTRNAFGPRDAIPTGSYGDLWWGGASQDGWGVSLAQQYRTLFGAWYTYDRDGRPVWYVIPGGTWTAANVYSGAAYVTRGSPWLGASYDPAAFAPRPVGNVTFTFHDLEHATMTYTIDGLTQSKPLTRTPF